MSDNAEVSPRDILNSEWFYKDFVGFYGGQFPANAVYAYAKILMEVASGDGVLHEDERRWVLGFASLCGGSQKVLDDLQVCNPSDCDDVKSFFQDTDQPYVQKSRLSLIYHGFRAAAADGELHAKEVEAIHILGKKLGIGDKQIEETRLLVEEENKLRKRRVAVLFPNSSFEDASTEFVKHHS